MKFHHLLDNYKSKLRLFKILFYCLDRRVRSLISLFRQQFEREYILPRQKDLRGVFKLLHIDLPDALADILHLQYIFIILVLVQAQQMKKDLRLSEVGWTLHIPPGTRLNESQVDSLIEASVMKISNAGGTPINFKGLHVLFAFLDPPYNGFASAISAQGGWIRDAKNCYSNH
jgi:hypothetical protein